MLKKKIFILPLLAMMLSACGGGTPSPEPGPIDPDPVDPTPEIKYLSVSEAVNIAKEAGEAGTSENQYVTGFIKNVSNPTYGEMYITDGTNDLYIYGLYSEDGSTRYDAMEEKPYSGDEIFVKGILKTYNNKAELGRSNLIKFISHQEDVDIKDYKEVSINQAREAKDGEKLIVSGVVSFITYANGMKPNGVYVVDNTGSIYIYGVEFAGRVAIGNTVKVAGSKTYYILDSEKKNAETFGYKGCCQLESPILVELEKTDVAFDKSWITEKTIKDILETPVSENITTTIYKTVGYINRVPGSGFVNFYINDLDNKTGSYCYSSNNGGDFEYLKQYDGKICEIYLSPINCKSTSSSAYFRFIPILVNEIEYHFDESYAPEFAIKYFIKDQFLKEYKSDPALKVLEKVDIENFEISNVAIAYSSDNSSLLNFVKENEELIMHTYDGDGKVKVTLSASYKTYSYQEEITINVVDATLPSDYLNVSEAIAVDDEETVVVRGVVASSLVNQTGFYLVDETGIIAVRMSASELAEIELGQELFISGTRKHIKKDGSTNVGQSCIDNASVVVNLYGNHDYSKDSFVTGLSFSDVLAFKPKYNQEDLSAKAYVIRAHLVKVESAYSTNYYISGTDTYDKNACLYLYAGSGSQYSAFADFVGKGEIEMEFAFCDWNTKSEYRVCLISASDGENTIINNLNFKK